jgi:hypothetical protein
MRLRYLEIARPNLNPFGRWLKLEVSTVYVDLLVFGG